MGKEWREKERYCGRFKKESGMLILRRKKEGRYNKITRELLARIMDMQGFRVEFQLRLMFGSKIALLFW